MEYSIESAPLDKLQYDCIIVGVYENQELSPFAQEIDRQTDGLITQTLARGDIEGKNSETLLLQLVPSDAYGFSRLLLVGLGKMQPLSARKYRKALSAAAKCCKDHALQSAACALADSDVKDRDWTWKTRQIVEMFEDACYQFTLLKSENIKKIKLAALQIVVPEAHHQAAEQGLQQGKAIADGISLAKELADLPGNICTPTYLAVQAGKLGDKHDQVSVHVLDEEDMEQLGMDALLSVSRGSRQPAKLITVEYRGAERGGKPVVLIGKGLTFDAGGISLKPSANMDEMKTWRRGVLGCMRGGIAASADQPGRSGTIVGESSRRRCQQAGDIITSMPGKTIEILNTDAEGRLILRDADLCEHYDPGGHRSGHADRRRLVAWQNSQRPAGQRRQLP